MAIQVLSLGSGQLSTTSQSNLYTSSSITTVVKNIRLVNVSSSPVTVNLYFKPNGGTARRIAPQNMTLAAGAFSIDDQEVTMGAGDQILGDASAINAVDWVMSGIQR